VVPLNVKYDANYPAYHYLREPDKIVTHGIATKSNQWSYEEEVRIIKTPAGPYSFAPECLKEVVFGCRMSESSKQELVSYIRDFGFTHAQIWQASCSLTSFQLELQRVS
jgi:hypothetical protein